MPGAFGGACLQSACASSSSSAGAGVVDEDEEDESLALARRLQEEDDAAMAAQLAQGQPSAALLMAQDAALAAQLAARDGRAAGPNRSSAPTGPLLTATPVRATLAAPAHKHVPHLGRNTAKKIAQEFKVDGSVRSLLKLLESPQRPRVLEMVDIGQRDRVEAECHALRIDLLPSE